MESTLIALLLSLSGRGNTIVFAHSKGRFAWATSLKRTIQKRVFARPAFVGAKSIPDGGRFRHEELSRLFDCLDNTLGIRCGANDLMPSTDQKNGNRKQLAMKVPTKTRKRDPIPPGIFQLTPISEATTTSPSIPFIQVKALLADRVVNWKEISRTLLGALICFFAHECRQTAGIPRRQGIWSLLHKAHLLRPEPGNDESPTVMPSAFQPTPLETFLAEKLARSARDMIPPLAMPSGPPLIGALLCCLAWILVTVLLPHWWLPLHVWYEYQVMPTPLREQDINVKGKSPTAVLIEAPQTTRRHLGVKGKRVVCKLHPTALRSQMEHGMPPFYFEHNHRRYYYDPKTNQCWDGGPNLQALTIGELTAMATKESKTQNGPPQYRGLLHAPSQLVHAQDRWYAYNHQTSVPIPTIRQALWERLKSPLVVIQLIGKTVAVLEDGKAAFISLGQTIFQHFHNARSMVKSSKTLQKDVAGLAAEFATQLVWIHRAGGWKQMEASNLLPGDLFLLTSRTNAKDSSKTASTTPRSHNAIVPVDALVLEGLCVTMEAVLTGESVPQTKMPMDSTMDEWNQKLDMMGKHRSAVVFAGTTILQCMPGTDSPFPSSKEETKQDLPQDGVLCLALRTGSYSSKGELINALTVSGSKAGVGTITNAKFDQDALRIIAVMSLLSTLACASLFWQSPGLHHHKVSGFRRLIQCTRIATACIPSDLPLTLSYVVQHCASVLRQEADVVCAQPGALLDSAEIETVVFDKTGTLTADTQSLSKVISYPDSPAKTGNARQSRHHERGQQSTSLQLVLAGGHSLMHLEEAEKQPSKPGSSLANPATSLLGDPIELAGLNWLGWGFNQDGGYFHPPFNQNGDSGNTSGVDKLWQLKVFPFSPNVRLSSALCLARHSNGEYRLWAVAKGAPEAVQDLLTTMEEDDSPHFVKWYERRVKRLESEGFRTLAMAAREVKHTDAMLFNQKDCTEMDILVRARSYAATVHRCDLEAPGLSDFCGLACFEAKVRPSSRRIVGELIAATIHPLMLTGDSIGAALAVAAEVRILNEKSGIALLERKTGPKEGQLQWRLISSVGQKDKIIRFTKKTSNAILKKTKHGELAMIGNGNALMDLITKDEDHSWCQELLDNLHCFSVVARASPECKESFVALLNKKRNVLMCGDGVNDVSAMKEAKVSIALLNGFGSESVVSNGDTKDFEDERRKQRLRDKRKRKGFSDASDSLDMFGVGSSSTAAQARIKQRIEAAQEEITQRAITRRGVNGTSTEPIPYTLSDIKDMVSSVVSAVVEERRRAAKLREGGGEAASILLEEDMLMRNGTGNATASALVDVRPGEACMASPFSCLRSSIDGVEAVLRAGIATAACTLANQQKMILNLLLTCFNLSALYRDGFKYSINMVTAEIMLFVLVEHASFRETSRSRPRLPTSRQSLPASLFEMGSLASVISQTLIHLAFTQAGISFARRAESQSESEAPLAKRPLIRPSKSQDPKVAALMNALITANVNTASDDTKERTSTFLGRPKFVPNYESNVVFALSILQSTLTNVLTHKGAPFGIGVLESPMLCLWSCLSILFAAACILETFPSLNSALELRPWMAQRHKVFVLGLALLDAFACSVAAWCCRWQSQAEPHRAAPIRRKRENQTSMPKKRTTRWRSAKTAADLEEEALREEASKNARLVLVFVGIVGSMALDALLKAFLEP